jgi:hypothetical protein
MGFTPLPKPEMEIVDQLRGDDCAIRRFTK